MAAVVTETMNGHPIRSVVDFENGRVQTRMPRNREASPLPRNAEFPRSASYTYIPAAKDVAAYPNPNLVTLKGSFSERDLIIPAEDLVNSSPPDSSGWTTPEEIVEPKVPVEQARELIAELHKSPKVTVQRFAKQNGDDTDSRSSLDSSVCRGGSAATSLESSRTASTQATTPGSVTPRPHLIATNSSSKRLSRSSRSSWYAKPELSSPSRSPSPPKKETVIKPYEVGKDGAPIPTLVGSSTTRRKSFVRRKSEKLGSEVREALSRRTSSDEQTTDRPGVTRRPSLLRRKTRPISQLFQGSKEDGGAVAQEVPPVPKVPKIPSLPKSFSTDRLPSFRSQTPQPSDRAAPMPRLVSNDRVTSNGLHVPTRKKDELWNVFRGLDGDYAKFVSKSLAFKAQVVRATLLPFLRNYATHPSIQNLRPEDLDRRANILNKWWTGLVEMLHGRNNQSMSGTDRPAILDGISGIMQRPEWRLAPSPFCPWNQRLRSNNGPRDRSTTSLSSGTSDFLTESVHHNVRNIFIQNLSAQMAFVVDKMSLRNASASLVTFCGKACAYAFMFVPGMADVLVRLWDLQMDTLRRVLDENGIGKFESLEDVSGGVAAGFPPALQQLSFVSLMKHMRKLRTPPPLPLGTANIEWWGHWLERWSGRESDLFYVFVKHFHILVTDFLEPESSKRERMCAPGMLLVHAQILTNLDSTIHRDAAHSPQDPTAVGPSPTFDDVLGDPDAVASTLPLPPTNAVRIMAENRLIMLIRDFLSERTADHPVARQLFAESFNGILQSAAKATSTFDHAGCYTLLDFLEEALVIMVRFEQLEEGGAALINSEFWLLVCQQMISSHNTMTEIRLYAFLYTAWSTIVADPVRKSHLCLDLLLTEEMFYSRFNHWCPMVRAYYMRLLCWRVGRFDGGSQHHDLRILETMHDRLQTTWSHFLYLREEADKSGHMPHPTNPCNPAPGRRLLIVRTDTQVLPSNSFLSFDGLAPRETPSAQSQIGTKRFSTLSHVVEMDSRPQAPRTTSSDSDMSPPEKGIGGFIRRMMASSKSRSKPQAPIAVSKPLPAPTPSSDSASTRSGLNRSATDDASRTELDLPAPLKPHRNCSFKFSLEYYPNKPAPGPMRLHPPKLPLAAQTYLLTHASRSNSMVGVEPQGVSKDHARYCGRALAEWTVVVGECHSFFERRKLDGVPENRLVETPVLGVEVFKRPS